MARLHPPSIPPRTSCPRAPHIRDVPALIISGELDNMTTLADGAMVAKRFPQARQLILANSFHVNALPHARSGCAAEIVRRFIVALQPGDTRCTQAVPEVRLVPQFARHVSELVPAQRHGRQCGDRRAAAGRRGSAPQRGGYHRAHRL